MHTYRKDHGETTFVVGENILHRDSMGEVYTHFVQLSSHDSEEEAMARVNYLNGGGTAFTVRDSTPTPGSTTFARQGDVNAMLDSINKGSKIEAIKWYRTITNSGLKEAKDAIECYWPHHASLA